MRTIAIWSAAACSLLLADGAMAMPPSTAPVQTAAEADDDLQDILLERAASVQSPLQQQVLAFYLERDFRPAWTDKSDVAMVRRGLVQAAEQGLHPADYAIHAEGAARDLALTEAIFRYARDVHAGRIRPRDAYKDVGLPTANFDPGESLTQALANHDMQSFLDSLPPAQPEYQRLIAALARYRAIAALDGWPRVSGEKDLARRLSFEEPDSSLSALSPTEDLKAALVRFQIRNGLTPDGKLSGETLEQLNVPVAGRIRQIIANLERWRWMPAKIEHRRIEINVPDQSLDLMDGDDIALHSRVIIGKKSTPTPLLRTSAVAVIANPSWDIPDDIAARQLLPKLRHDAGYLAARNLTLVDAPPDASVNWRKVTGSRLPYQIREAPGPDNALGRLMLDSPNDFDVYMHDTPAKSLFAKGTREASNGCIRVEQIDTLVSLALDDDAALDEALASGETRRLALSHPLPVYMLYWTAIAGADGTVGFRPDRYGRDAVLLAKLGEK